MEKSELETCIMINVDSAPISHRQNPHTIMHILVLWPAFGIENMRLPDTLEKVGAQLA
jgi:hypothetical protein